MKTITSLAPSRRRQRGQGMSEYLIIVAVIAVAGIGVFGYFGDTISSQVAGLAHEISGTSGASDQANAQATANSASDEAAAANNMATYHENGTNGE